MADDGQAEVLAVEHLLEPLGPFEIDDLGLDPDGTQLGGDDLSAAARIGGGRELQRGGEALGDPGLVQQAPASSGS